MREKRPARPDLDAIIELLRSDDPRDWDLANERAAGMDSDALWELVAHAAAGHRGFVTSVNGEVWVLTWWAILGLMWAVRYLTHVRTLAVLDTFAAMLLGDRLRAWACRARLARGRDPLLALGRLRVAAAVGPLCEFHDASAVRAALTELLANLPPDEAERVSAYDRTAMCQLLGGHGRTGRRYVPNPLRVRLPAREAALRQAILGVLAHVGGQKELHLVEALARGPQSAGDESVAEAARECLPPIQARAALQRAANTLGRAAEAPAGAGLLRPASGGASADDSAQLLRPLEFGGD